MQDVYDICQEWVHVSTLDAAYGVQNLQIIHDRASDYA
jgi:hypothetical protein